MELEEFKSEYQKGNDNKSRDSLREMGRANRHPVLKKIRLQLIIESVLWAIVLSVYYTGFDGDHKAWYWNVALVASIILLLLHNALGYRLVQSPINGTNIAASLKKYAFNIKLYARTSIASRVIAIIAILAFFASSIAWNEIKMITGGIFAVVLLSAQIFFLVKIWTGRLRKIQKQIGSLKSMDDY